MGWKSSWNIRLLSFHTSWDGSLPGTLGYYLSIHHGLEVFLEHEVIIFPYIMGWKSSWNIRLLSFHTSWVGSLPGTLGYYLSIHHGLEVFLEH